MAFFDGIQVPAGSHGQAVRLYLEAHDRKDFANSVEFFAEDVVFNGLVLKTKGRAELSAALEAFTRDAFEWIRLEAIAEAEVGDVSRVLALYWIKLGAAPAPLVVCDLLTIRAGRIVRVDNVFDLRKAPPM